MPQAPAAANASGWYKGDLHCHTFHSDGLSDPREVVQEAERLGLDFLAITDHNTFTHQIIMNQIDTTLMLIPGCEVTTFRGHWNIWGEGPWIDFRVTTEQEMEETIRQAVQFGYLTSCNHPRPEGPPWRFPEVEGYQCVEAWNGPWYDNNETCLSFWEARLKAGERLVAVGGSDCHQLDTPGEGPLGQPTTYVYIEGAPSPAAVFDVLQCGHAFITRAPDGPQLYLTSGSALMGDVLTVPIDGKVVISVRIAERDGNQLEIVTDQNSYVSAARDGSFDLELEASAARYVRAQLREVATGYISALTNPIYLDRPAES